MKWDDIKNAGTVIVTVLIFIFVGMWSIALWQNLGKAPVPAHKGLSLGMDEYARAKDIFILVLPLLTTAVGYWFGSQGTVKAQQRAADADTARNQALEARSEAQVQAAASKALLDHIKAAHPEVLPHT